MTQKRKKQSAVTLRKQPTQERSQDMVSSIVEAAARILETRGLPGFNTNAVAEHAGVSIGSLYQYFPGKHALLSALIEREMAPLLHIEDELVHLTEFRTAIRAYIAASVRNQMRRPQLARSIDIAEKQEMFNEQILQTLSRLTAVMVRILALPGAPQKLNTAIAAEDTIAIIRALVDVAGERAERESNQLLNRIDRAVFGYLNVPITEEQSR